MKKLEVLGLTGFLVLNLASCTPSQNRTGPQMNMETNFEKSTAWRHYESEEFGISFNYPPVYIPEPMQEEEIVMGKEVIPTRSVVVRAGTGEAPFIDFMDSTDARFLEYLAMGQPFEKVIVGEKTIQKFVWDGMGTPIGYLLTDKAPYVAVIFVFPPDQETIERVLESINIQ